MTNWNEHPQYIPDEVKTLEEGEATYALREAWHRIYGAYPSDKSLGVLFAKSALETGRWKFIHCYNFGNIKKVRSPDDGHFFCMYRCGEVINGKHLMFDPPHLQTHFRGYKTPEDGAEDYIKFVSQKKRYLKAWEKVIQGDPAGYSRELKIAGYYTADEARYTAGVVRLFDEFMKKKEALLSWRPDPTDKNVAIETPPEPILPVPEPIPPEPILPVPEPPITIPDPPPDTDVDNKIPEMYLEDEPEEVKQTQSNSQSNSANIAGIIFLTLAGIFTILSSFFPGCQ